MKRAAILSELHEVIRDVCFDDGDGFAKSRRTALINGYLTAFSTAVTTGTFFTVLMLAIGADDVYFGYVTMISTLCSLIQMVSPLLWERLTFRKPLIVTLSIVSNFLTYGVITCIPFFPCNSQTKLIFFLIITLITSALGSFTSPASNAWSMHYIPLEKRVNYTSISSLGTTIINIISTFLAGVLLDLYKGKESAAGMMSPTLAVILIFRLIAFAAVTWASVNMILFIREIPSEKQDSLSAKDNIRLLIRPLRSKPFLLSILPPCLWAMCSAIIGNFFNLQLVENVKMSYTLISSANFISTPLVLLLTPLWTVILKKRPWVKMLSFAFFGYCCAWCCNVFISADTQIFYFIAIIFGTLFDPCINMVKNNLLYFYIPKEDRTAYFGFYSIATSLFAFLGHSIGTVFVKRTEGLYMTVFGVSVCNLQLTSAIAAALGLGVSVYTLWFYHYSEVHISQNPDKSDPDNNVTTNPQVST